MVRGESHGRRMRVVLTSESREYVGESYLQGEVPAITIEAINGLARTAESRERRPDGLETGG